ELSRLQNKCRKKRSPKRAPTPFPLNAFCTFHFPAGILEGLYSLQRIHIQTCGGIFLQASKRGHRRRRAINFEIRKRSSRALCDVFIPLPAFHDKDDAAESCNVVERIAVNADDVPIHARRECSDLSCIRIDSAARDVAAMIASIGDWPPSLIR